MDEAAVRALIEGVLAPNEALLWEQAAPAGPLRSLAVFGTILIVVLIAGFLALTRRVLRTGGLAQRALLALPLVLLIGGLVVSVQQIFAADATAYAVTEDRVLIVSAEPELVVRSYPMEEIYDLEPRDDRLNFRAGDAPHEDVVTLWGLSDAAAVEALIVERQSSP